MFAILKMIDVTYEHCDFNKLYKKQDTNFVLRKTGM